MILIASRCRTREPEWLQTIYDAFGERQLVPMTASGDRGLACEMQIEDESVTHLLREICEVFEETCFGCQSAETTIGVVHVCHTADTDIEAFLNVPAEVHAYVLAHLTIHGRIY